MYPFRVYFPLTLSCTVEESKKGIRMGEAYIIDAVRTPVGRRGGGLAEEHPADLGAHAIKGLIDRVGVDTMTVDDVLSLIHI